MSRGDDDDDGSTAAAWESDDDIGAASLPLHVVSLPERPARLVSIEQEIGSGGNYAASQLCEAGFTSNPYMGGYHGGGNASDFCYVEEDCSVAGEIIYRKLDLSDPAVARRFESALSIVQDGIRERQVKLDMRCGLHIHVDIATMSMRQVTSLYHLWNYVEDTVFRLASANWRKHRTEVADENYAPKTRKGFNNHREVGNFLRTHRGALNLGNYLYARGCCICGASQFGEWSECSCRLEKTTAEFRVFNASANVRKIRAYVALCTALVAYAESHEVSPEEYPPLEWTDNTEIIDREESETRLGFILHKLPLTDSEREDIRYCAEASSLAGIRARQRRRRRSKVAA